MSYINWSLQNQGGFQNALGQGMAFGQQIRKRREEKAYKSALAGYDPSNPETIKPVMEVDPRLGIALRRDSQARQAAAQKQSQIDMGQMRQLLKQAEESPEGYAQAIGAAQELGLDVSRVPQQYDPAWVQNQLFILDAFEKDEQALPGIARELEAAGVDVSTEDGQAVLRKLIEGKYAGTYTDGQGNIRQRPVFSEQQTKPQAGAIEDGYKFKGGDPADPANWEEVSAGNSAGGFPSGQ